MNRVLLVLAAAFLAVVLAARVAYSVSTDLGDEPVNKAWVQNKMEFVAWNGQRWTAWIHDGGFELAPENTRRWSRHSSPSIAFTNWDGEYWQARIDGDSFLLAYRGNWQEPSEPVEAIQYRDWFGINRLRTVADLRR